MRCHFLKIASFISILLLYCASTVAQEVAFSDISSIVEVGTVAVALLPPRAQLLPEGGLATAENVSLLVGTKKICVLPYDAAQARSIIEALPSFSQIQSGLEAHKSLRQLRSEVAEELSKKGFEPVDCLSGIVPDSELLFYQSAWWRSGVRFTRLLLAPIRERAAQD